MADKKKISIKSIKDFAAQKAPNIDLEALKENAAKAGDAMNERASELKNSAMAIKEDVANKLNELDRMLEESITEYNDAYTQMNDKGIQLFNERGRSTDTIEFVEALVNSIANKPKSFEADCDCRFHGTFGSHVGGNYIWNCFYWNCNLNLIWCSSYECCIGMAWRRCTICRWRWYGSRKCVFGDGWSYWVEYCRRILARYNSAVLNTKSKA